MQADTGGDNEVDEAEQARNDGNDGEQMYSEQESEEQLHSPQGDECANTQLGMVTAPGRWTLTQVLDPGIQMAEEDDDDLDGAQLARAVRELRPVRNRTGPSTRGVNIVSTGLIFTLTTHNPETHPLPHPDLLLLHAAVMRVARAAGAAPLEEDYDWDTEDETRSHIPAADVSFRVREFLENLEPDHMEPPNDPGL